MRLIFMGNPQFAVPTLEKLLSSKHEVAAVVTSCDRPQGRGQKLCSPEVAQAARRRGLRLLQAENLRDPELLAQIRALAAALIVVVAFRILPVELFSLTPRGAINLHASLLPRYRGAAPIQWALINGDSYTGLTTFLIRAKVDTGGILLQRRVAILPGETADELSERMAREGAELVVETVARLEQGEDRTLPQDERQVTLAPKLAPEDGRIEWSSPAVRIVNLIRGLSSVPGAFTSFEGKRLKLFRAEVYAGDSSAFLPGEVLAADPQDGLVIKAGEGAVRVTEMQLEGKKRLACSEFLRGCPLKAGLKLG